MSTDPLSRSPSGGQAEAQDSLVESWNAASDAYARRVDSPRHNITVLWPVVSKVILQQVPAQGTLLDFGCGPGEWCRRFAELGFAVTGIDPSPRMIDIAESKVAPDLVRFRVGSGAVLSSGAYDAVVCVNVLQDLPNMKDTLNSLARALRPKGVLVAVIEHPAFLTWREEFGSYASEYEFTSHFLGKDYPVQGFHRPISAYLKAAIECGLALTWCVELPASESSRRGAPTFLGFAWTNARC